MCEDQEHFKAPKSLEKMRKASRGPWAPPVLAEDVRRTEADREDAIAVILTEAASAA